MESNQNYLQHNIKHKEEKARMETELFINQKGVHVMKYKSLFDNRIKYHLSFYAGNGVRFECTTDQALTMQDIESLDMLRLMKMHSL